MPNNIETSTNFNRDVLNLYSCLNQICIPNDNGSDCLDLESLFNALHLLYEGTADSSRNELKNTDLQCMIDLINSTPKSSSSSRLGVYIDKEFEFQDNYVENLQSKGYAFDVVPTEENLRKKVNARVKEIFPNYHKLEEDFFEGSLSTDVRVCIKTHSYFHPKWQTPFPSQQTKLRNFDVGEETLHIPTLVSYEKEEILTYDNTKKNLFFVSLPFQGEDYGMVIVMPKKPHTKKQLLDLITNKTITAEDLRDFHAYQGEQKDYIKKRFPLINIKTRWDLEKVTVPFDEMDPDKCSSVSYLKTIMSDQLNLMNISTSLSPGSFNGISLLSSTDIIFSADGTDSGASVSENAVDCSVKLKHNPILHIDKSFLFFVVKNMGETILISKIGCFVGPV